MMLIATALCITFPATVVRGAITAGPPALATAQVSGPVVEELRIVLSGNHTFMGDLLFNLTSPTATMVEFGPPGCGGEDWLNTLTVYDSASRKMSCGVWAGGGPVRPQRPFTAFSGQDPSGTWALTITHIGPLDDGVLSGVELALCRPDADMDGVADDEDNCPVDDNPEQEDSDADGIGNVCDNCATVANPTQCDTNGDGYGNHCDADLNDSGVVNFTDLNMMKAAMFTVLGGEGWNEDADLNCNGSVNFSDMSILKQGMFQPPGPSGVTQ